MTTTAKIKSVDVSIEYDTLFDILRELESGLVHSAIAYAENGVSMDKFQEKKAGILEFMRCTMPIAMPGLSYDTLMKEIQQAYKNNINGR